MKQFLSSATIVIAAAYATPALASAPNVAYNCGPIAIVSESPTHLIHGEIVGSPGSLATTTLTSSLATPANPNPMPTLNPLVQVNKASWLDSLMGSYENDDFAFNVTSRAEGDATLFMKSRGEIISCSIFGSGV